MKYKQLASSLVAVAVASALTACDSSNQEGLADLPSIDIVQISLVCQSPDSIKVDSFGQPVVDESGAQSCERVELVCSGQVYDAVTHSCAAKGRHENAPDEVAEANTQDREDFATIFFSREDLTAESVDSGIIIHAWNSESCNAYDPDYIEPGATQDPENDEFFGTDWATGLKPDGFDENYGLFWTFKLLEGHSECANFIIHKDSDKFPDGDMVAYISRDEGSVRYNEDRMSYVLAGTTPVGNASVFPYYSEPGDPTDGLREIDSARAVHWFNRDTLLINDDIAQSIRVYSTEQLPTLFPGEGFRGIDYVEFTRSDGELAQSELDRAHHRSGMAQFVANTSIDDADIKTMLQGRLMAVLVDDTGEAYSGYLMQNAGVLDDLYTTAEADADEAPLGITYDGDSVTAAVWAPTASNVALKLYSERDAQGDYTVVDTQAMTLDQATGIWSYEGDRGVLDRQLFRYEVSVYHHVNDEFVTHEVIDPYAISVTTNGRYARFVDLNDADTKPENWDDHVVPAGQNPEDIIVYEGHIRDFSVSDQSTSLANRGKYLAFTEQDSAPVNHLKALAQAGLTHFQVLPSNDIASIEEDSANAVDVSDNVSELCAVKTDLAICTQASGSDVISDALSQLQENTDLVSETLAAMQGLDSFNWGYDPYAFNAPEGSYSTDPESVSRIIEMRAMVQSLHEMGLRTSIDVVYNHTSSSGLWDNSVLDKVVPGYYHRLNIDNGDVLGESCCQDTAGENRMFGKLVTDSLVSWSQHFKFDAFRFDLMNLMPRDLIIESFDAVAALDSDTYFYGEGWTFGAINDVGASIDNMAGTEIATFSFQQRDGVRNGALFNSDGNRRDVDNIRAGLTANLADYVLQTEGGSFSALSGFSTPSTAKDPADTVNYVSKHDNETLWDQLQFTQSDELSSAQRARIHAVAGSFPLLSQGIPFFQMGSDLLRSKSMNRNSYDAGDLINKVDFTKAAQNWNVSFPSEHSSDADTITAIQSDVNRQADSVDIEWAANTYQDLLKIRSGSSLFRLTTAEQVIDRLGFHNTGGDQVHGVIVMSLDDGAGCINSTKDYEGNCDAATDLRPDLDPSVDALVVVFNGSDSEQTMMVPSATGFALHGVQLDSSDSVVASSSVVSVDGNGEFTVPAFTTAVFVKAQMGTQGQGVNAFATAGVPDVAPYGANTVYIRGDMNSWGTDHAFEYTGEAVYEAIFELDAGTYGFKVAASDWSFPNIGGGVTVALDSPTTLGDNGDNLSMVIPESAKYKLTLDASNPNSPILTIKLSLEAPVYPTTVYVRGTVNANGGWNTNDPLLFVGDSTYVTSISLTAGSYQFKLASEDWSTVSIGAGSVSDATVDAPLALDGSDNVGLTIAQDGVYTFSINATDAAAPIVTVSLDVQPYAGTPIYLRGFDGEWGTVNEFAYFGAGYYAIMMDYTNNTDFKIASDDWSTVNLGGSGLAVNEVFSLSAGGDNISLTGLDATSLQFILKVNDDSSNDAQVTVINLSDY